MGVVHRHRQAHAYNLWEELVEKQNMALGMVVAAMSLGISLIVAAAIHG